MADHNTRRLPNISELSANLLHLKSFPMLGLITGKGNIQFYMFSFFPYLAVFLFLFYHVKKLNSIQLRNYLIFCNYIDFSFNFISFHIGNKSTYCCKRLSLLKKKRRSCAFTITQNLRIVQI